MKVKNLLLATLLPLGVFASNDHNGLDKNYDPNLKTFITNNNRVSNSDLQVKFSQQTAWKNFSEQNGSWTATFNEETGLPHNAYGTPVNMGLTLDAQSTAWGFITSKLAGFQLPVGDLVFRNTARNQKYFYVNYTQQYNGVEILWSRMQVKVTPDGRIPQFLMNVYNDINLNTQPTLSASAAQSAATAGLGYIINNITTQPAVKIIAVPVNGKNEYHLVYEVNARLTDNEGFPREYYTLVDAHSGTVMYRQNRINSIAATDVNVTATVYPTNPYNPTAVEPLANLFVTVNSSPFATDANGYLGLTSTSAVTATFKLEGTWCDISTNGITPQFNATLNPGPGGNNISFTAANIKELSAYNSVNEIHDYYVATQMGTGAETVMDYTMSTLIDVAGSCNAFYDGNLNFFDAGGNNCGATSIINDVVYHEYGHGINDQLYQYYGGFFGNGALGEGYADTWANGLTEDPVLGIGFYTNDPTGFVRRYDIDRKVFPADLQGEVHADGEIIAGAWWDVGINFGNFQQREALYAATFAATLDAATGDEGILYHDVLIEALTCDDNDGNLANGTPNYCAITSAFALHGINLFSTGPVLAHVEPLSAPGQTPININVSAPTSFSGVTGTAVNGYYKTSTASSWNPFTLTFNGSIFQGNIPAQPNGTIVQYYVDANDPCNTHFNMLPNGANDPNPNLPYYILVGYNLLQSDYFNNGNSNGWTEGLPSDQATTGMWDIVSPIPSIVNPGGAVLSYVQTPNDHTPTNNNICAVTGNAASSTSPLGDDDIDTGPTSLVSPTYDLSSYQNPAITYWRWYSNDQGAAPGTDFWQVYISNDGTTYIPVESTTVADHSWRRFAFRVADYVTPNSTISVKFVAQDDLITPSLVEAAMDDFEIWDSEPLGVKENSAINSWYAYPNPVKEQLTYGWNGTAKNVKVQLTNNLGQVVYTENFSNALVHNGSLSTKAFANGVYTLQLSGDNFIQTKKITVLK